ncbi:unnamed protein product, partial [marine sediment metagenome]
KLLKTKLPNESFLDRRIKVIHEGAYALFPLIDDVEKVKVLIREISNLLNFELVSAEGIPEVTYQYRSIKEALVGELPENILESTTSPAVIITLIFSPSVIFFFRNGFRS